VSQEDAIIEAGARSGINFSSAPTAELVIDTRGGSARLAYAVNFRGVNANNGIDIDKTVIVSAQGRPAVLYTINNIHESAATATFNTMYSGQVTSTTNSVTGGFELRDPAAATAGPSTPPMARPPGQIYTDADNTWGNGTNRDVATAAADAQYGVGVTWDYYKNVHGRSGIANNGTGAQNRVHYGRNYVNAYWSDSCFCMTYGDGDGRTYGPLVNIDVAGHEMSHGVTSREANLTYSGESRRPERSQLRHHGHHGRVLLEQRQRRRRLPDRREDLPQQPGQPRRCATCSSRASKATARRPRIAITRAWAPLDVHYSSGVANHFFYILAEGNRRPDFPGQHPRPLVQDLRLGRPARRARHRLDQRHRPRRGAEDLVLGRGQLHDLRHQLRGRPYGDPAGGCRAVRQRLGELQRRRRRLVGGGRQLIHGFKAANSMARASGPSFFGRHAPGRASRDRFARKPRFMAVSRQWRYIAPQRTGPSWSNRDDPFQPIPGGRHYAGPGRSASAAGNGAADRALSLIQGNPSLVRASSADRFQARDVVVDADGTEHVRFDRSYGGLPVIGGDFVLHSRGSALRSASLTQAAPLRLSLRPSVPAADAIVTAGTEFGSDFRGVPTAKLVVYARGATPELAWRVGLQGADADGNDREMTYFVSARDGRMLDRWSDIETFTRGTTTPPPSTRAVQRQRRHRPGQVAVRGQCQHRHHQLHRQLRHEGPGPRRRLDRGPQKRDQRRRHFQGRRQHLGQQHGFRSRQRRRRCAFRHRQHLELLQERARSHRYRQRRQGRAGARALRQQLRERLVVGHLLLHELRRRQRHHLPADGRARHRRPRDEPRREQPHRQAGQHRRVRRTERSQLRHPGQHGRVLHQRSWRRAGLPDRREGDRCRRGKALRYMFKPSRDGLSVDCWSSTIYSKNAHYSSGVGNHFFYLLAQGAVAPAGYAYTPAQLVCNGNTALVAIGRAKAEKIWYPAR
jgi:Zn-dependent metalloprotease